jgi:hypothetical protein
MDTTPKKPLVVLSIAEFAKSKGIVSITPKVRANTNGFPYVTMINGNNEAENVYFSKAAATKVAADMPVTTDMLKAHQIGVTHNEAGEERIKLISNSERLDLFALLD